MGGVTSNEHGTVRTKVTATDVEVHFTPRGLSEARLVLTVQHVGKDLQTLVTDDHVMICDQKLTYAQLRERYDDATRACDGFASV